MIHSPPLPAPTLADNCRYLRNLAKSAERRPTSLTGSDIDAILAVVSACELAFGERPAVTGEGA